MWQPREKKGDFKDQRNWKNEGWTGKGYVGVGQEGGNDNTELVACSQNSARTILHRNRCAYEL